MSHNSRIAHESQPDNDLSDLLEPSPDGNLAVALDLARRRFVVFPITLKPAGDWTPIKGWRDAATRDVAQIREWWRDNPSARVGLPTGKQNGITVLDIDRKHGKDGFAELRTMGFDAGKLSPVMVQTPSGGAHAIFAHCEGLRNSVGKIAPGLDVRTDGGFIVAPGSFKDGKQYAPRGAPLGTVDLPPFPDTLRPAPEPERAPVALVDDASDDQRAWAAERLQQLADGLAQMKEGDGRNVTLNSAAIWAGGAAAHGFVTEDQAKAALCLASERCGMSRREFENTFRSGWDAGLRKPISDFPQDISIDEFGDLHETADSHDLSDLLGDEPKPSLPAVGNKLMVAKNGEPKPTLTNATIFLGRVVEKRSLDLRFNLMTCREEWRDGAVSDADLALLRVSIEREGMHKVGSELIAHAVQLYAKQHAYHPVRDWLDTLKHDGKPRLNTWLSRYLGAEDSALTHAIGRAFLIAMVARVMSPGCKHDCVLVLSGEQGIGKSTACKILGGDWYGDDLPGLHNKAEEAARYLQGKWLVEIGELAPARKADANDLKSFLSRAVDENRAPYARKADRLPRQTVFVGTTNDQEYLSDPTGGRRFWPVACGEQLDLEALGRDRDQLFAEAVAAFRAGEQWHLTSDMQMLAAGAQEEIRVRDPWEDEIASCLAGNGDLDPKPLEVVTMGEALGWVGLTVDRREMRHNKRMAAVLKSLGWKRSHTRKGKVWVRP